jgi:hypothetical protein
MIFPASLLIGQSPPIVGGEIAPALSNFRAELQPSRFKYRGEFCQKASEDLNSAIDRIFAERMHPNLWMTFGGMGSKKLSGLNIEYIAKNDTHPGAHFNSEFRS